MSDQEEKGKACRTSKSRNGEDIFWARRLSDVHTRHCKVVPSRFALLQCLPRGAVVAEIGTLKGKFAAEILKTTAPSRLHIIDLDFSAFQQSDFQSALDDGMVILHPGDSSETLSRFPDRYFDWIYIDGDHSIEGVTKDVNQAIRKVKEDGLLVFNDYTNWSPIECVQYGTMRAINDLCIDHGYEFLYLALSGCGYHDVAIRKMGSPGLSPLWKCLASLGKTRSDGSSHGPDAPLIEARDLGRGWRSADWFGRFMESGKGWIYHSEHGWMCCSGTSASGMWFWSSSRGWMWSRHNVYPSLWSDRLHAWLWYYRGTGNGSGGWFYNCATRKTEWL